MHEKNFYQPFLWSFVKNVQNEVSQSGGQERPLTESLAEENSCRTVIIDGQ